MWSAKCTASLPTKNRPRFTDVLCKVTKWSIAYTPAIENDETPPGLHVFPIREAHNRLQIPQKVARRHVPFPPRDVFVLVILILVVVEQFEGIF